MNIYERVCPVCEREFEAKSPSKKYCSTKCRNQHDYATHPERHKTKSAEYRKTHPERCRAYAVKQRTNNKEALARGFRERHKERREWILGIKASLKCSRCGEARPACLDFHHLDGSMKEHNISTMIGKHHPKERILNEIAKCVVLCRNCHAVEHFEPLG
jgi:hypothetical protein